MSADAATLGAKLLYLLFRKKFIRASPDALRIRARHMMIVVAQAAIGDWKAFVRHRYMCKPAVGQASFRRIDKGPESACERAVVQHPIYRQQHRIYIEQFIEDLDVRNARMRGTQQQNLGFPLAQALPQALAEQVHEGRIESNAFVDNDP